MTEIRDERGIFLETYEKYVAEVLSQTKAEMDHFLKSLIDREYPNSASLPSPSPVCMVECRLKRPESVVDKITADNKNVFPERLSMRSLRTMNDTVAGRVIVYFLSNLLMIHKAIVTCEGLDISQENLPIAFLSQETCTSIGLPSNVKICPKSNGYNAIHYVVRFNNSAVAADKRPWVEIQIRTLTEHVWGQIEHLLGYKPEKKPSPEIREQFRIISKQLSAIDQHFELLFGTLSRAQEHVQFGLDDLLDAENLAAVLRNVSLGCAQDEVTRILKIFENYDICYVKHVHALATPERLAMVQHIYKQELATEPSNSEMIASLVAINGINEQKQIQSAIRTQINYHKTWKALQPQC